ncbi:hypothetical protein C8R44DRAFT_873851 [Mycena epipterygia]|nr:hypothetical protein C8R44DRAFT_873851 [Mycena epipterygia]
MAGSAFERGSNAFSRISPPPNGELNFGFRFSNLPNLNLNFAFSSPATNSAPSEPELDAEDGIISGDPPYYPRDWEKFASTEYSDFSVEDGPLRLSRGLIPYWLVNDQTREVKAFRRNDPVWFSRALRECADADNLDRFPLTIQGTRARDALRRELIWDRVAELRMHCPYPDIEDDEVRLAIARFEIGRYFRKREIHREEEECGHEAYLGREALAEAEAAKAAKHAAHAVAGISDREDDDENAWITESDEELL